MQPASTERPPRLPALPPGDLYKGPDLPRFQGTVLQSNTLHAWLKMPAYVKQGGDSSIKMRVLCLNGKLGGAESCKCKITFDPMESVVLAEESKINK